ncbi:MAG: hypothetical protein ACI8YC_000013 [Salibacteraceae bacterium]|jgi:hypothetical protein
MNKLKEYLSTIVNISIAVLMCAITIGCEKSEEILPEEIVENNIFKSIWLCPMPMDPARNRAIVTDYVQVITQPEDYYAEVFEHTKVLKLYIEALNRYTADDIQDLVDFTNAYDLEIAVEVGGIRMKVGQVANTQIGVASAEFEFRSLNKLITAGGNVNYISTDHSMAPYLTGRKHDLDDLGHEGIMGQMMEYFKYMQVQIPGLKVGTIESLGFFWVLSNRQYQATDKNLNRVDFESFMDMYTSVAEQHGIVLDHFHTDFGMHDVQYDQGYGRILAVENYLKSKNVNSGFIGTNAFHEGRQTPDSDPQAASISAAQRTIKYFEDYIKAGGAADDLILQRWQPYPTQLGSDIEPYTQMGIFNSIIESDFF